MAQLFRWVIFVLLWYSLGITKNSAVLSAMGIWRSSLFFRFRRAVRWFGLWSKIGFRAANLFSTVVSSLLECSSNAESLGWVLVNNSFQRRLMATTKTFACSYTVVRVDLFRSWTNTEDCENWWRTWPCLFGGGGGVVVECKWGSVRSRGVVEGFVEGFEEKTK